MHPATLPCGTVLVLVLSISMAGPTGSCAAGLERNAAAVPPLAYSTWNYFNDAINETLVRELGDGLIMTGLADLGFKTINIDAGWLTRSRHPITHELVPNATKFPNGMKRLASELNAKGLGLGLYSDIGNGSCGTGPGSYGHYETDAKSFSDWGISYLKMDFCGFHGQPFSEWVDPVKQLANWRSLRDAIGTASNDTIYLSICPHGTTPATGTAAPWYKNGTGLVYAPPPEWTTDERRGLANSILVEYTNLFDLWYDEHWEDFRQCGPTKACPTCKMTPRCHHSSEGGLLTNIDAMVALTSPADSGPGTWADADMLQVCNYGKGGANAGGRGDGGMTLEEYRASYAIWAILASPIIISADVRTLSADHPECLAMLKNSEMIAIHQDALAKPGYLARQTTNASDSRPAAARTDNIVEQVFVRELSVGAWAVVLFNRAERPRTIAVSFAELGLPGHQYSVTPVWENARLPAAGDYAEGYTAKVEPHHVVMIKLVPTTSA